uniref:Uncharacterized protein n=1 Tax=Chromera velia CCMP2878 TaxID=1169474 RepID=A0A0G4GTX9_9ALVE|eukprot:Cvel_750.t1-p1 / transcript=Cvel_750.t1 / gene=Cvel_750 / organism=Chromera_velia_CCMP2878 / gene_product=hypothetical protein / transcript_product=hypothetical protein / location=Cvel_scaffold23:92656-93099(+) / protein_length=148 / sequence_SO=supercontig / SO=protein_coding / is_pseudo=false
MSGPDPRIDTDGCTVANYDRGVEAFSPLIRYFEREFFGRFRDRFWLSGETEVFPEVVLTEQGKEGEKRLDFSSVADIDHLLQKAKPAPCGKGEETAFNPGYRSSSILSPGECKVLCPALESEVLPQMQKKLAPHLDLSLHFHQLIAYQ